MYHLVIHVPVSYLYMHHLVIHSMMHTYWQRLLVNRIYMYHLLIHVPPTDTCTTYWYMHQLLIHTPPTDKCTNYWWSNVFPQFSTFALWQSEIKLMLKCMHSDGHGLVNAAMYWQWFLWAEALPIIEMLILPFKWGLLYNTTVPRRGVWKNNTWI